MECDQGEILPTHGTYSKMNIPKFFYHSRGGVNLLKRLPTLFKRFGWTSKKIEKVLHDYMEITKKFDCYPTFPVTAVVARRYPKMIRKLHEEGAEFAIHGYVHTDYSQLSEEEHRRHLVKAIRIFEENGIPFQGFRSPYLRWNGDTQNAIHQFPFHWTSQQVVVWDVINLKEFSSSSQRAYEKVLNLYRPLNSADHPVLPQIRNGIVEIPVSIPDDETLVDRLGIRDSEKIYEIWRKILDETHRRGEVFVLQLHHERIPACGEALEKLLRYGKTLKPPVWVATLSQIALWWKERNSERWPNGFKSALSVTGDIDSITLFDFMMRIFEV